LFARFDEVPLWLRKGSGTKKAPLLATMFPPADPTLRALLRER
jgi:hypothetical protein